MKKLRLPLLIIFGVLLFDQVVKVWIKTNMFLGQEFSVIGDWFRIHFTENEGMAFGLALSGDYGKLLLTFFRLGAVVLLSYYLWSIVKSKAAKGLIISIALILAGALGNIVDSVIYGVIFSDSMNGVASFLPAGGGYAALFHGKVVDMLYFPLFQGYLPDWLPVWGGEYFIFFRPVFNIADSAITVGVFMILLFQRSYFKEDDVTPKKPEQAVDASANGTVENTVTTETTTSEKQS